MRMPSAVIAATLFTQIPAWPQSGGSFGVQDALRALEMEQNQTESQASEVARRKVAAYEARQFELRLADFARTWNDFVKEYSDRGTYNLKKAKSLSRALKKLQAQLPE